MKKEDLSRVRRRVLTHPVQAINILASGMRCVSLCICVPAVVVVIVV